jgi:hypothetical protein
VCFSLGKVRCLPLTVFSSFIFRCYSLINHTVVFWVTILYCGRGLSIYRISCCFFQDRHVSYVAFWMCWQYNVPKTDSHRPELTDLSHNNVKVHGHVNFISNIFHWQPSWWEIITASTTPYTNSVRGELDFFVGVGWFEPWGLEWCVVQKRLLGITTNRSIITQKNVVLSNDINMCVIPDIYVVCK